MSPLITHRRSRRRSWSGRVVLLVCVLVVAAVLIGGLTQVGRQSGPFDASVNRSFATQAAVVADQSNATAVSVRRFIRIMQRQDRQALEADLDTLAAQASQQAARAAALAAPDSQGGVQ